MLDKLKGLLPTPKYPIHFDESILEKNQAVLGTEFPSDFLDFSRRYGSGSISVKAYEWEVYGALDSSFPQFVDSFRFSKGEYREAMETFDVPLGLYPEEGGLLPFAVRNDVYFTWKTDGSPDEWRVVVLWTYDIDGYEQYDQNFSEFLVKLLTRQIQVAGFKTEWDPAKDISFEPEG